MKLKLPVFLILIILGISLFSNCYAKMNEYVFPYDISEVEWQLLNWTSSWKNTNLLADPFLLERMEFQRKTQMIDVYLYGKPDQATDENLQKSIDKINEIFSQRFPKFNMKSDMAVHFTIKPDSGKAYVIEYAEGSFDKPAQSAQTIQPAQADDLPQEPMDSNP